MTGLIRSSAAGKVFEMLKACRRDWLTKRQAAELLGISTNNASELVEEMAALGLLVPVRDQQRDPRSVHYTLARAWGGELDHGA